MIQIHDYSFCGLKLKHTTTQELQLIILNNEKKVLYEMCAVMHTFALH